MRVQKLFFALVLVMGIVGAQNRWEEVLTTRLYHHNVWPNSQTFSFDDIHFVDSLYGWAVGWRTDMAGNIGFLIIATTDGGRTWFLQYKQANYTSMKAIFFVDRQRGWTAGGAGYGFYTTDGGRNWTAKNPGHGGMIFLDMYFVGDYGWVVGNPGLIWKTTDFGQNWTSVVAAAAGGWFNSVIFIDRFTGWVCGYMDTLGQMGTGVIKKTTDGGETWFAQYIDTTQFMNDIDFIDALNGWAAGDEGTILKTTDGGATWFSLSSPTSNSVNNIDFTDLNNGWIHGQSSYYPGNVIWHSTDGGNTWEEEMRHHYFESRYLTELFALDSLNAWTLKYNKIFRYIGK